MTTVLILFTIIGFLGAFDTLYHHEFKERLPWRPKVKNELKAHALRNVFYSIIFLSLGWLQWEGIFAWLFLTILLAEVLVTFTDFALESKVRKVPAPEIMLHTLLGIVYGGTLALLIPIVLTWTSKANGFSFVDYGLLSWIMVAYALAVLIFAFRDYVRSLEIDNFVQAYSMHLTSKRQKVLLTGGTGFIGSKLTQALIDDGHDVSILTRNFTTRIEKFSKKITLLDTLDRVDEPFDIILNLAGEKINQRWTEKSKVSIMQSRLETTQAVIDYIKSVKTKPKLLISSSGIGIYEASLTEVFSELSPTATKSFTAKVCQAWEAKAFEAQELGVRVVPIRTGLVLATDGGVLSEMLTAFDLCLGNKLGDGKQMMPWIAMQDMLGIIEHTINHEEVVGVVNATAPNPVSNELFSKALAQAMKRPMLLPTPVFMLELFYGKEMTRELLLEGRAVLPQKIQEQGYKFKFTHIEQAMNNLFRKEN